MQKIYHKYTSQYFAYFTADTIYFLKGIERSFVYKLEMWCLQLNVSEKNVMDYALPTGEEIDKEKSRNADNYINHLESLWTSHMKSSLASDRC